MTMIKKDTLAFLADLVKHNDREWFQENKQRYETSKENVDEFAEDLLTALKKTDKSIPAELAGKKCVMRIYRDVRFSKDKSPYKNNFGMGFSAKGKGMDGAGYYLHIQPGRSFLAGGYWMPPTDHLKAIRQEIDYNADELLKIIEDKEFKKYFDGMDEEEKLKTTPKGYEADHPHIELLKLKSFTVTHRLKDTELTNGTAVEQVRNGFKLIHPLNSFLTQATA